MTDVQNGLMNNLGLTESGSFKFNLITFSISTLLPHPNKNINKKIKKYFLVISEKLMAFSLVIFYSM